MDPPAAATHPDVRYLGYVPDGDLPLFYNAARVFVYPSFYNVDPASVQSIAEAITALIENRDVVGRSVEAGLARAAEFQWGKTAEQMLEVYFSVVNQGQ